MVDLIGYPKLVLNTTWLDSVYSDVEVSDDDYLVNYKLRSACQTQLLSSVSELYVYVIS